MTRKINLLIAFLLALTLALTAGGVAEAKNLNVDFTIGYNVFGYVTPENTRKAVNCKMDVTPFIENGRTYVPVRYLAYGLGVAEKDVNWDEASQTVTLSMEGTTVKLQVGSKTIYVNGKPQEMDVTPLLRNGRVFLPARFVAEAFGYKVFYRDDLVGIYLPQF
ncbi:copper amine oxidase N-terminal domain-containing protein [Neomoorella thermoacetica]|uniref:copper amine oxidase N-terminal domain-containing protein n=1 Tax=Neomoorella thermoacetica TaxID=1525 RepID=UPI0008FA3360|nr:copper amine oxidase N-terminal domain-containing protein [Moorella thermoacetica]OIQ11568.1 primary amine oxidase precursor [Moorella thermoacetica]OIQ59923.1 primary amine oxidase precursor [Moorella thermoacetica]